MRVAACLSILLVLLYSPVALYLPSDSVAGELSLNLDRDTLSIDAENVALQIILREIAGEGIIVKIDPQINPLINASFKNRPLEQALDSLLKPASYSLLWEAESQYNDIVAVRLAEIQVFQSGKKDQIKQLLHRSIGTITKNPVGIYYVKDEILIEVPAGIDPDELQKILISHGVTLVGNNRLPGLLRILLPENSDVFAIARDLKSQLNLEISHPNYAYPVPSPVRYSMGARAAVIDPGGYVPTNNTAPIAILDSGLAGNAELEKFVLSSLDALNPNAPITDSMGHGTQMALIASGIVQPYGSDTDNDSYIPIIPIRAFDESGFTTDYNIVNAINFALAQNARVMSLSWSSETRSDLLEKAFTSAKAKGLIIVASAGNEPSGKPVYPAAYPAVIGIGALDPHGKTWEKSNFGTFVAFYAPGFASLPVGYNGGPGLYAGTSIATAFVAHTIADYLSVNPDSNQQEVLDFLSNKYRLEQQQRAVVPLR